MQKIHPQETETQQAKKGDRMESSREGNLEISFFFFPSMLHVRGQRGDWSSAASQP